MRAQSDIRILYLEDDETLAFLTSDHLSLKGYEVVHVETGEEALSQVNASHFDLCILDIMLPGIDGLTVAERIRKANREVPIIFLSARTLVEDRITALRIGADDYLVKPFRIEELLLKIEVFLRRSGAVNTAIEEYVASDVVFRPTEFRIQLFDKDVKLTAREAEVLEFLWKHANKTLKREEILLAVWGDDDYFLGRSLDVFISRLRKMLAETHLEIENVHGVGFVFHVTN
ncbi:response regulator transcription factor [Phaeocystidibacter marisrubri]|uniref:Response regulator transcription factor n=1 Tax=Phaeocystidibacter marisrubri TaxID=1577780 RepID=A0A6L3ZDR6_9FLAO|nr:response regulator transcription factor [Phaeocystidibacter marisrubri]KAB2815985.1 response regulator transcription factor [Phaeocystidibacter marisrubri]GGH66738.1 DNA-binding response regulator [Phaeocystidibacter marisrubri]